MCDGIYYMQGAKTTRYFFPNPRATLPVRKRNGEIELIPWGRRTTQAGKLPMGGAARRDAIHAGRWDRFNAKPVRIALTSFMVKDFEGNSCWYDLTKSQFLQGLLAQIEGEQRVYIVTIEPEMEDSRHAVWPRIVSEPKLAMEHSR